MALIAKLIIIDEDQSESGSVDLDAADLDSVIDSLRANGYPKLASTIVHAIDPEFPVERL